MANGLGADRADGQGPRGGEGRAGGALRLYRNYLRMVVRTGLGPRLRERVELSDVVQEALVEVIRQFPQFTGQNEAALVGWLRRLVGQKLADLARYHNRVKRSAGGPAVPLDAPWNVEGGGDAGGQGGADCSTCSRSARPARARRPAAAS